MSWGRLAPAKIEVVIEAISSEPWRPAARSYSNHYIKVTGYNARYTRQTIGPQFMVNRPKVEPGFRLDRTETNDRDITYNMHPYAGDLPHGTRYQGDGDGPEPD